MANNKKYEPLFMLKQGKRKGDITTLDNPPEAAFQKVNYFDRNKYNDYVSNLKKKQGGKGIGQGLATTGSEVNSGTGIPTKTIQKPTINTRLVSPGTGPSGYGDENILKGGNLRTEGGTISANEVRSQSGNAPTFSRYTNPSTSKGTFNVLNNSENIPTEQNDYINNLITESDKRGRKLEEAKAQSVKDYDFQEAQKNILDQANKIKKEYTRKGYPKTALRESNDFYLEASKNLANKYLGNLGESTTRRGQDITNESNLLKAGLATDIAANKQDLDERRFSFDQDKAIAAQRLGEQNLGLNTAKYNLDVKNKESLANRREIQNSLGKIGINLNNIRTRSGLIDEISKIKSNIDLDEETQKFAIGYLYDLLQSLPNNLLGDTIQE